MSVVLKKREPESNTKEKDTDDEAKEREKEDDDSSDDSNDQDKTREEDEEDEKKNDEDEKERSVELIFTTGAGVVRRDENGNEYLEVLSLEPGAVDLSRLNSGAAPLLNSHSHDSLSNILGVIERAYIDPNTNQGIAKVRFSRRPDVDPILQDVKDKIIVSTSVGYGVNAYKDITKPDDEMPVRLITSWTPHEISLVGIPADVNSRVRKKYNQRVEMRVMNKDVSKLSTSDVVALERKRCVDIRKAVKAANLTDSFAENLIERGVTMGEASELIIREMTKSKTNDVSIIGHSTVHAGSLDEVETRRRGIENAILHKIAPQVYKLEDQAKRYMGYRLVDCAEVATRGYGGIPSEINFYKNPIDTFTRAFNGGTSDFPAILANVMNKELRRGFESAPPTWQVFCRKVSVNNLKPIQRPQLGEAPLLERVNEKGEYRRGGISETNQTYSIEEWGKIMSLPLRVLLDDDLSAFGRIPSLMGRAAIDNMSEHFYSILGKGPKLRNGDHYEDLFSKDNKNLSDTGEALTIKSLSTGRTALRQQTGQDGRVLNLILKYILLPSAMESEADTVLSQNLLYGAISTGQQQSVNLSSYNPFAGKLIPIIEPRLDAFSQTAWYLVADLDQIDVCEVAYLNGQESPQIISRDGFTSSGVEWRINHFWGFGWLEYRSWYKFPHFIPSKEKKNKE